MYAFNRRLEVAFQTHKLHGAKLVFKERGKRLDTLEAFLKQNIKKNSLPDARGHQDRWVERLITAASDSGAKIPPKRFATQLATPWKPSNVGLGKPFCSCHFYHFSTLDIYTPCFHFYAVRFRRFSTSSLDGTPS
ncbi:hypothetical protein B0H14DRAFT_2893875 [Mycena olivaceomarginata]|nr:hypothetical protein B0H14DRAFT_2893875 [Mycena olivaceomarginata]